jgi:FtsH-binding integral membrane protein
MQPSCLLQVLTALLIICALFESFKINKETALTLGIALSSTGIVLGGVLSVVFRRFDKYSFRLSLLVAAFFITFFSGIAFLGRGTGAWGIWGD